MRSRAGRLPPTSTRSQTPRSRFRREARFAASVLVLLLRPSSPGAQEFLLHDNGPAATGAIHAGTGTAAPAGSLWSEVQPGNSTIGFNANGLSRIADDFPTTPTLWIRAIEIPAYDADSPSVPSPFDAATLRIWDAPPWAGGSIVFGDATNDRLTTSTEILSTESLSTETLVFRVNATFAVTTRKLWANRIDLDPPLLVPAGETRWIDFRFSATDGSGGTVAPVTLAGQAGKPGANARQFNSITTLWNPLRDSMSSALQDVPFRVFAATTTPSPTPSPSPSPSPSPTQAVGSFFVR